MARKPTRQISLTEVEYVAHRLAQELMEYNEPIPPFETRFPERLESCLRTPFQTFNNKSLYPTIERKSAMLFYLLIKNHPFQNGNKRIAVVTLLYFLSENRRWLKVSNLALYNFAKEIAMSDARKNDEAINHILIFFKKYLIIIPDVIPV